MRSPTLRSARLAACFPRVNSVFVSSLTSTVLPLVVLTETELSLTLDRSGDVFHAVVGHRGQTRESECGDRQCEEPRAWLSGVFSNRFHNYFSSFRNSSCCFCSSTSSGPFGLSLSISRLSSNESSGKWRMKWTSFQESTPSWPGPACPAGALRFQLRKRVRRRLVPVFLGLACRVPAGTCLYP